MVGGRRAAAWVAAGVLLAACGSSGSVAGEDARTCSEIAEDVDDARTVLVRTFGSGVEGRSAYEVIITLVEARPDCFTDEEVESLDQIRALLPSSDAEADALRSAEEACGGEFGYWATSGGPGDDTPVQALAESGFERPAGQPEQSFEEGSQLGFDYYDDGVYQGWVLVEQTDGGWFVKRSITCGADTATEEPG